MLDSVKPHKLMVPRGDRTGVVIEPMLTDQWFVAMTKPAPEGTFHPGKSITEVSLDVVRDGQIKFVPENWTNTYYQWMDNIQDWCISRQLWWGHRIPAWYDENGNVYVGRDEADARAKADAAGYAGALKRDEDVLDTWFSSALVPFSTLGWPQRDARAEALPALLRAGHRLRHHLLLGRPHDHDDHALHEAAPRRCRSRPSTCTAWCATTKARRCPSARATCSTRWTSSTASPWRSCWPSAPGA